MAGIVLPKDFDWENFLQKNEQEGPKPETPSPRLKPVSDAEVRQLLKDVDELKRWRGIHAGIDWASAGIDYPHPNLHILYAYFGGRLAGIGPEGIDLQYPLRIAWRPTPFSPFPTYPYASIIGDGAGLASGATLALSSYNTATESAIIEINATSAGNTIRGTLTRSGTGRYFYAAPDFDSGNYFLLSSLYFVLGSFTSDPTWSVFNGAGSMLYRSDTGKFRVRNSTTTYNVAVEGGPIVLPFAAKTGNYTTTASDGMLTVDASGAARTITLVTAVGNAGLQYTIKKIDSSVNLVTIDGNGSQTIDGVVTTALSRQYEAITIISDGANWLVQSRY